MLSGGRSPVVLHEVTHSQSPGGMGCPGEDGQNGGELASGAMATQATTHPLPASGLAITDSSVDLPANQPDDSAGRPRSRSTSERHLTHRRTWRGTNCDHERLPGTDDEGVGLRPRQGTGDDGRDVVGVRVPACCVGHQDEMATSAAMGAVTPPGLCKRREPVGQQEAQEHGDRPTRAVNYRFGRHDHHAPADTTVIDSECGGDIGPGSDIGRPQLPDRQIDTATVRTSRSTSRSRLIQAEGGERAGP